MSKMLIPLLFLVVAEVSAIKTEAEVSAIKTEDEGCPYVSCPFAFLQSESNRSSATRDNPCGCGAGSSTTSRTKLRSLSKEALQNRKDNLNVEITGLNKWLEETGKEQDDSIKALEAKVKARMDKMPDRPVLRNDDEKKLAKETKEVEDTLKAEWKKVKDAQTDLAKKTEEYNTATKKLRDCGPKCKAGFLQVSRAETSDDDDDDKDDDDKEEEARNKLIEDIEKLEESRNEKQKSVGVKMRSFNEKQKILIEATTKASDAVHKGKVESANFEQVRRGRIRILTREKEAVVAMKKTYVDQKARVDKLATSVAEKKASVEKQIAACKCDAKEE
eukprot:TRINITY_DN2091_c0_g1_i1.p1 TRINITY_DN2091_c0_g1~~TRINITY_DN2091_c0_g1_i1.p1  ORF type:complete len:332 (+),score=89.29 TRINITY_DN2091_c0_g1_i1:170-1165(+)